VRRFVRQAGFKDQATKLCVSFSFGSVDGSCQLALSTICILAEEDFGSPRSAPTWLEMTAHLYQPKTGVCPFY
jgi:hypothetical protein